MKKTIFTGSYAQIGEKGIVCLEFDTETGSFNELYGCSEAQCPSYVLKHPGKDVLYVPVNISAAIRQSEDGEAVFVSNRGHDSIAVFKVLDNGLLEQRGWHSCLGRTPRDFQVVGNRLIIANQDSDSLNILDFCPEDFSLEDAEGGYKCIRPTCVEPV